MKQSDLRRFAAFYEFYEILWNYFMTHCIELYKMQVKGGGYYSLPFYYLLPLTLKLTRKYVAIWNKNVVFPLFKDYDNENIDRDKFLQRYDVQRPYMYRWIVLFIQQWLRVIERFFLMNLFFMS